MLVYGAISFSLEGTWFSAGWRAGGCVIRFQVRGNRCHLLVICVLETRGSNSAGCELNTTVSMDCIMEVDSGHFSDELGKLPPLRLE